MSGAQIGGIGQAGDLEMSEVDPERGEQHGDQRQRADQRYRQVQQDVEVPALGAQVVRDAAHAGQDVDGHDQDGGDRALQHQGVERPVQREAEDQQVGQREQRLDMHRPGRGLVPVVDRGEHARQQADPAHRVPDPGGGGGARVRPEGIERMRADGSKLTERAEAIVVIEVRYAAPLVSPAYDDGMTTEAGMLETQRERFARLHARYARR
jgi:hypothetical protein